jgi:hypothetical protein
MAVKTEHPPGWLITADGAIIGDIGTHGPVDEAGRAEIGYGLAAPAAARVTAARRWPRSPNGC